MMLKRKIFRHVLLGGVAPAILATMLGGLAASPEKPAKKSIDAKGLDHPEPPKTEREEKSALTREISGRLPKSPRIEVNRRNYIDDFVFGKIQKDKIPHAGLSSDLEFVRRIHLDLTGQIPESEVIRKFINNEDS